MHKVFSGEKLPRVTYKEQADGNAHVWVRSKGKQREDAEDGTPGEWEADEAYFTVTAEKISEAEIKADVDFWLRKMGQYETDGEPASGDDFGAERYKAAVRAALSDSCTVTITQGIDVELSTGTEHFSLTQNDQTNLIGLQMQLLSGAERVPYHKDSDADGTKPCAYYSAEDAAKIVSEVMTFKTYHTTYCNSLFCWLDKLTKASDMEKVIYGAEVPEEFQSVVLKDILTGGTA